MATKRTRLNAQQTARITLLTNTPAPLPWGQVAWSLDVIIDAVGNIVATVPFSSLNRRANVAQIVGCVNTHGDLVTALRDIASMDSGRASRTAQMALDDLASDFKMKYRDKQEADVVAVRVMRWYDVNTRDWIVQRVDAKDNPVGGRWFGRKAESVAQQARWQGEIADREDAKVTA